MTHAHTTQAPTHAHGHTHGHAHTSDHHVEAEILELDAQVLAEHTAALIDRLPLQAPPRRIVDLGCGTGAGTFALLDRFPEAHVAAVDTSAAHLQRVREKACARGDEGRVRTVQADLDAADWPDLGTPDLVWASASMHHMADPDRALRTVHGLLTPGGLLAVVELSGFPASCPPTPPRSGPAWRSGATRRAPASTPNTCRTGAPTGARS